LALNNTNTIMNQSTNWPILVYPSCKSGSLFCTCWCLYLSPWEKKIWDIQTI